MASRVRTHTRKTASGGTTRVTQHSRAGRPRKPVVSPGHAWELLKRALRANKRKKRFLAAVLATLAAGELTAWATLSTTSLILVTTGIIAIAVGTAAGALGGVRR